MPKPKKITKSIRVSLAEGGYVIEGGTTKEFLGGQGVPGGNYEYENTTYIATTVYEIADIIADYLG